jgi:CheY-like chemotaxis protein
MIPAWRNQLPRSGECPSCARIVEISHLARGPVYCSACRQSRRQRSQQRAQKRAKARRAQTSKPSGLTVTTVLVVEDELLVRRLIMETLSQAGYCTLGACTGEAALALFRQHRAIIGLTILDMVLPGMSGLDLAAELGRQESSLSVLYISGWTESLAMESIALRRPELFLPKPFKPLQLIDRVNHLLRGRSSPPTQITC